MPELEQRIARLPPEKRRLLEHMLGREAPDARPVTAPSAHPTASLPEPLESCRRFYDRVSMELNASEAGRFAFFLNYGYAAGPGPHFSEVPLPEHCLNRNCVRMVLELIGDCDLMDKRVLDVGCGRGGTVSVIHEFFHAKAVVGVDLAPEAVRFCTRTHQYKKVFFLEADAQALPMRDGSFDVVTNLESSHSYNEIRVFYSEVYRSLGPGGRFLYTDLLPREQMERCRDHLAGTGFEIERERDISENVLLSCDEMALRNLSAFQCGDRGVLSEFLALPGSSVYRDLASRRSLYRMFKLRKSSHENGSYEPLA
jgi:SAM-dependent methyltransferase